VLPLLLALSLLVLAALFGCGVFLGVYTDSAGTPLASDEALIDYNPILSEQESPWSVIGTYNPAYTSYRIEFRDLLGGSIVARDDRQQ
jgi:hypothetical protein